MGYCMHLEATQFHLPKKHFKAALKAIQGLAGKETIRDGGGRHFSWVDSAEFINATTLEAALEAWRWHPELDEKGDIVDLQFEGEKSGDDEILFGAIAPFVKEGSYIQMMGEDGHRWRWKFNGKACTEVNSTVVWDDE